MLSLSKWLAPVLIIFIHISEAPAQTEKNKMVRLASLVIDSTRLEAYNILLKEEIETSLNVEPGVQMLFAVAEKDAPHHITILEIYADAEAYRKHVQTSHFLKYKNG